MTERSSPWHRRSIRSGSTCLGLAQDPLADRGKIKTGIGDGHPHDLVAIDVAQADSQLLRRIASILSQLANGAVPRSAIESNPMTAIATASVATVLVPAMMTPGLTAAWGRLP